MEFHREPEPKPAWYSIANAGDVASPALLLYRSRIEANLREMLRIAGDPAQVLAATMAAWKQMK